MDKLSDDNFEIIKNIISKESGIVFNEVNRPILEIKLKERVRISKTESYDEYFYLLLKSHEELKNLIDHVTTNLTNFFRYQTHFDSLEKFVIPDLIERKKHNKEVKIWSAGCSTGEEAYSIAMMCNEFIDPAWKIDIVASDISFNSLIKAKEGYYNEDKISNIPKKFLEKYLVKIGNGYYIKDHLKKIIHFDYHNLQNDPVFNHFDVVFCRNVIIYFDKVKQKKVVNILYKSLNRYGYFFIGHSESLYGMETKFQFNKMGSACIYTKNEV